MHRQLTIIIIIIIIINIEVESMVLVVMATPTSASQQIQPGGKIMISASQQIRSACLDHHASCLCP